MADQGNKKKPLSFLFPYWTNPSSTSQQRQQPQRTASRAPAPAAQQQTRRQSKPQRPASTSDPSPSQEEPEPQISPPPPAATTSQTELPRRTSRSSSGTALPVIRTKTRTPSVPSSPRGAAAAAAAAQSPVSSPPRATDLTTTQETRAPSRPEEPAQAALEQLVLPVNAANQVPPVSDETSSKKIVSIPAVSELPEPPEASSETPGLSRPDFRLESVVPQESNPRGISEKYDVPNKPATSLSESTFDDQHLPPPVSESQSPPRMSEPENERSKAYGVPSEPTTSSIELASDDALLQQLTSISQQSPEPLENSVPTEQNFPSQPTHEQYTTSETKPSYTKEEDANPDFAGLKTINEIKSDSQPQPLPQSPFSVKESSQEDELPAHLTSYPSEVPSMPPVTELEYSPTLNEHPKKTATTERGPAKTDAFEKLKPDTEDTKNEPVGKEEPVPDASFSHIFKADEVPGGNKEGTPSPKSEPPLSLSKNGTLRNYELPTRTSNTARTEMTLAMQKSSSSPTSLDPLEKPKASGDPFQNQLQEMELNDPLDSHTGESEQAPRLRPLDITKSDASATPDKSRGEKTTSEKEQERHGQAADQIGGGTVFHQAITMRKEIHSKRPQTGQLEKQPTATESLPTIDSSNGMSNSTKMPTTSDSQHQDAKASLQKEIKDGISNLMKNLASKFSEHTGGDLPLCIITLAGENKGASMLIGKENVNSESVKPIQRSHNLSHGDNVRSRPTNGQKQQDENSDCLNGTDRVCNTSINSNTQSINNSILQHSSCSEVSPGVHLTLTAKSADLLNLKEQTDASIADKA